MNNIHLREYRTDDLPSLKTLWVRVFGDPPGLVDDFFRLLPGMGSCFVAEDGDSLLAMASVITGFHLLLPGEAPRRCAYLYAVATEETARSRGLGAAVSRGAAELGRKAGAEILCTLPAENSLYDWYWDILSLRHVSSRTLFHSDALPEKEPLSSAEYGSLREALLHDEPHVMLNRNALEFQGRMCASYGGGMFASGESVFCGYADGSRWVIQEWLGPDAALRALPGFLEKNCPHLSSDAALPAGCIWNLSFD